MQTKKTMPFFKLALVSTLSSVLLVGCNDGGSSSNNDSATAGPTVEYEDAATADNNLANYTNADWLFQNYLGEYGLPDELKTLFMPELMMLANGFALQHSLGEDVDASIAQFNTSMQMMHYSGELGSGLQQMMIANEEGVYNNPTANSISPDQHVEIIISPEAQENIDKSNKIRENYRKKQEQLVIDHNLPYPLPERELKHINYNQAQATKRVGVGKEEHRDIDKWDWWEADIASTDGAYGLGHMGLVVDTRREIKSVIDAHPDGGVRKQRNLDLWANEAERQRVEGWRYGIWNKTHPNRLKAVDYAEGMVGKPYRAAVWGKDSPETAYCSQLVWQAYYMISNQTREDRGAIRNGGGDPFGAYHNRVDLDYNGGIVVFPDDILNHINTVQFNSSVPSYESYRYVDYDYAHPFS